MNIIAKNLFVSALITLFFVGTSAHAADTKSVKVAKSAKVTKDATNKAREVDNPDATYIVSITTAADTLKLAENGTLKASNNLVRRSVEKQKEKSFYVFNYNLTF